LSEVVVAFTTAIAGAFEEVVRWFAAVAGRFRAVEGRLRAVVKCYVEIVRPGSVSHPLDRANAE
jgi:hypothetical protein